MATKRVTRNDVINAITEVLDNVKDNAPNGCLDRIEMKLTSLEDKQAEHTKVQEKQFEKVSSAIHKLEKRLYNPDDGVVVTVKENTRLTLELAKEIDEINPILEQFQSDLIDVVKFKSTLTRVLWVLLPGSLTAVGWAVYKIFMG